MSCLNLLINKKELNKLLLQIMQPKEIASFRNYSRASRKKREER